MNGSYRNQILGVVSAIESTIVMCDHDLNGAQTLPVERALVLRERRATCAEHRKLLLAAVSAWPDERKIVSFTTLPGATLHHPAIVALCDDGTMWQRHTAGHDQSWNQIKGVPQA